MASFPQHVHEEAGRDDYDFSTGPLFRVTAYSYPAV